MKIQVYSRHKIDTGTSLEENNECNKELIDLAFNLQNIRLRGIESQFDQYNDLIEIEVGHDDNQDIVWEFRGEGGSEEIKNAIRNNLKGRLK